MGIQRGHKLNRLQKDLPEGLLVDASWLERHGYSRALRNKYVAHGWLEQLTRGVYRRPAAPLKHVHETDHGLRWQAVVISLQTVLGKPYAVGGRTALELQGFAHYLETGEFREVHLYGRARPPAWLAKLPLKSRFVFHNAQALFKDRRQQLDEPTEFFLGTGLMQQSWGQWDWPLTMSAPERAILELLAEVPQRETFHQADMLMQGLRTLSPKRLRILLTDCRSIKVKRLFLWLAERHNHAWLKHLDRSHIDLGAGKRMLQRGGKLDTQFNITVPENLDAGG